MTTSTALADHPTDDALPDLDAAREHVAARALHPAPTGPIGLELEAHLVDRASPGTRVPWHRVTAAVATLPPLDGGSRVTLEPGGQVELSGPPAADVTAAVTALRADLAAVRGRLATAGLGLAPLGADPCRPAQRVSPGSRYVAMEEHFQALGHRAAGVTMMTSTAALQVNVEAGPRPGWAARVRLAQALGPVLVAVSACSPMLAGSETGWRSGRQRIWAQLDPGRCGPLPGGPDPTDEWAAFALAAPVMLVRGPAGEAAPVRDRTSFADWVRGAGPTDRRPTVADLEYHLTTLFPPVRLRGYLELRYLDAAPEPWWPALSAVAGTLLDDPVAADTAAAATEPVSGRWEQATRIGLADPELHAAAAACLEVAVRRAPAGLRAQVTALAELVERRASPGDALLHTARTAGPAAALLAATHDTEEAT
ncbi:ergothioneine biosynthesis glutamate--cysteine ligase EgtA [Modestobacter sp. VKM Ac-2985]|uniref:ergothioneine biosynthesis glutamate--cysteine ligase EgtA n=1 Tax=Modestobacter sp. VKM Ac-2985 TaxID=3004139 RepID=UPI0022AB82DA|nr:ergothioneine biosynthesis glutamate--cysteine ligase EgtA [Modestobacter sp. VKM Ac-2985]MCZ2835835.1 ergothioneine biosynthesis glutamate--cysteine ligase EgtA [Modestobacter sp. VKM Ac-2985]